MKRARDQAKPNDLVKLYAADVCRNRGIDTVCIRFDELIKWFLVRCMCEDVASDETFTLPYDICRHVIIPFVFDMTIEAWPGRIKLSMYNTLANILINWYEQTDKFLTIWRDKNLEITIPPIKSDSIHVFISGPGSACELRLPILSLNTRFDGFLAVVIHENNTYDSL